MIKVMTRLTSRTLPRWPLLGTMMVFMISYWFFLVANDDFGGLHAFGVDLLTQDLPRAFPTHVNQLGCGDLVGSDRIPAPIIRRIALINVEIEIIALGQQHLRVAPALARKVARRGIVVVDQRTDVVVVQKRDSRGGVRRQGTRLT